MAGEIVPFGKYKGQPVEAMAADRQYLDWLTAQPWFAEKFQNIYTIIVNNFQEPSETPEHNALQARFLDEDFRAKFLAKVIHNPDRCPISPSSVEFEQKGFDVYVRTFESCWQVPEKSNENKLGYPSYIAAHNEYWYDACHVEIKPTIGDDYPAVLRQIKAAKDNARSGVGRVALLVGNYCGRGVNEDQFIQIMESAGIHVVFLDEL